jgi:transcriptional regulator
VYLPPHFEQTRTEELHRLIEKYPLGAWVVSGSDGLDANHVPFHLELNPTRLLAHVARP